MNPYEILGVSPDADEETIKKAYRSLVKKYHPDKYVNTPMAEVASEKMKQINEAYDMITNKNTSNSYQNGSGYSQYSSNYDYSQISYATVRRLIAARRLNEAERMLSRLDQNAEWYYLKGLIYLNKGWYAQGMEYVNTAIKMDPYNNEYRATANNFNNNAQGYKNVVFTNNSVPCSLCTSLCASYICCNMCNCCGCC